MVIGQTREKSYVPVTIGMTPWGLYYAKDEKNRKLAFKKDKGYLSTFETLDELKNRLQDRFKGKAVIPRLLFKPLRL